MEALESQWRLWFERLRGRMPNGVRLKRPTAGGPGSLVLTPSIRLNFGIRISDAIQERGRESTRESRGRVSRVPTEPSIVFLEWSRRDNGRTALHCTAARGARGELGDRRCGLGWGSENRTVWTLRYFSLGADSDGELEETTGDYRRLQDAGGASMCLDERSSE